MPESTQHYTKAPIVEGLIDLRVAPNPSTTIEALQGIHSAIKDEFPERRRIMNFSGTVSIGAEAGATVRQRPLGISFASADGRWVLKAQLEGFTVSRLAPYTHWEDLRDQAQRLWEVYVRHHSVAKVTRIAVRYINQIHIPMPFGDFKEYLRTVPEVSSDLPQELAGYTMRMVTPYADSILLLNQATEEPTEAKLPIMLDIDLFRPNLEILDFKEVWPILEQLRHRKNEVFEACITDATRQLIR